MRLLFKVIGSLSGTFLAAGGSYAIYAINSKNTKEINKDIVVNNNSGYLSNIEGMLESYLSNKNLKGGRIPKGSQDWKIIIKHQEEYQMKKYKTTNITLNEQQAQDYCNSVVSQGLLEDAINFCTIKN